MKIARRSLLSALLTLAISLPLHAQTVGKDYIQISPAQPSESAAKIEVVEFFGYFCPHCRDAAPQLHVWATKLPADVVLKKVPVSFGRQQLVNWQRLYYTLEVTGDAERLDGAAFKAAQDERLALVNDEEAFAWAARNGVDRKKFQDAWKSFSVNSMVQRAGQMERAYKVSGVPALAVDGKFMIGDMDFAMKLAVTDKLIVKTRTEKSGKK